MSAQVHDRITIEPDKMDGQPCIRGLRFPVVTVLRMVVGGMSVNDIAGEHPDLQPEDIPAALNYAAEALAELTRWVEQRQWGAHRRGLLSRNVKDIEDFAEHEGLRVLGG